MGCFLTELLRPNFVSKIITDFLCHLSTTPCVTLDDVVTSLELELTKIQPFKRELPLCIILLNDGIFFFFSTFLGLCIWSLELKCSFLVIFAAIIALKVESTKCRGHKSEPVLQDFIPLKKVCDQKDEENRKEKECIDKKNWMSSVQLWNNNSYNSYDNNQNSKLEIKVLEEKQCVAEGRDFVTKEEKEDSVVNGLSMKNSSEGSGSSGSRTSFSRVVPSFPQMKTAQKQRRSWSPELHRRFVEALEELGGSQG